MIFQDVWPATVHLKLFDPVSHCIVYYSFLIIPIFRSSMDSSRAKPVSLTIAILPSSSSSGLRELADIPAGQQVSVLAKANERLPIDRPPSSEWEISDNILAYKKIQHSLTSGVAEEADTTTYPFQASLHSKDERNRSSVPFYISLRANVSLIGAWFLHPPGTYTVKPKSQPAHVSAFPLPNGQTWIGLASPTSNQPAPTTALLTCNLHRPSGRLYTITLAQGSLHQHTYTDNKPTPTSTTVFTTTSPTHTLAFSGSSFPTSTHELDPSSPSPSLPLISNTGFLLSPSDADPSLSFSYSMLLRTYILHLSCTRDSVPSLLGRPLEHGFRTTVAFDTTSQAFTTSDSAVVALREHADMRMPTWSGNIVLSELPSEQEIAGSAGKVESSAMAEGSSGMESEEARRRKLLLQRKERGWAISTADARAAGLDTLQGSAKWEREATVGREGVRRTRANV